MTGLDERTRFLRDTLSEAIQRVWVSRIDGLDVFDNRAKLEKEIGAVMFAIQFMIEAGDISEVKIDEARKAAEAAK